MSKNDEAPIPSVERLDAMVAALKADDPLDAGTRRELIELLDYLAFKQVSQTWRHRGRDTDPTMRLCSAIVLELHERHGVKVEAAVSAMVRNDVGTEDSRRKLRQNIERAYRSLKASGVAYPVSERYVLDALKRLRIDPAQNRK